METDYIEAARNGIWKNAIKVGFKSWTLVNNGAIQSDAMSLWKRSTYATTNTENQLLVLTTTNNGLGYGMMEVDLTNYSKITYTAQLAGSANWGTYNSFGIYRGLGTNQTPEVGNSLVLNKLTTQSHDISALSGVHYIGGWFSTSYRVSVQSIILE